MVARKAVVPIRYTTEERERLYGAARSVGLSLSEYVRRAALKRPLPKASAPEVNRDTYRELCRIGNNLNQLMRAIHEGRASGVDLAQLTELKTLVKDVGFQTLGASDDRQAE